MKDIMLEIRDVYASASGAELLKGVNMTIRKGEIHVLMGPNGAGKSTLMNVVMGHPRYELTKGSLLFEGEDITAEKTDVRAKKGIFLCFQHPEELPGVSQSNFLRAATTAVTGQNIRTLAFRKMLKGKMEELNMDEKYASRSVNVGFSGGEKKKNEIFQMMMLNPKLTLLDEPDSGLDVDAVKTVSEELVKFKNDENSFLIITHSTRILDALKPDFVHILTDGRIVTTQDASLIEKINREGFSSYES